MSRKQLDLCNESAEEPLFRNYLANGTPSCIVALVTIERIVRGDVRWHSDNFGKGRETIGGRWPSFISKAPRGQRVWGHDHSTLLMTIALCLFAANDTLLTIA
jgi:hypothetical protein